MRQIGLHLKRARYRWHLVHIQLRLPLDESAEAHNAVLLGI